MIKNLPAAQEFWVRSLGWEDPLEKGMATHSSILSWRIPRPEEPGGLQSMGSETVRHDWVTNTYIHTRYIKSCIKCILFSIVEAYQAESSFQTNLLRFAASIPNTWTSNLYTNLLLIGFLEIWKHSKVANVSFLGLTSWTEINRNKTSFSLMETQSGLMFGDINSRSTTLKLTDICCHFGFLFQLSNSLLGQNHGHF